MFSRTIQKIVNFIAPVLKSFKYNPFVLYKRNQLLLSFCLLFVCLSLCYVHSINGKAFILTKESVETLAYQFFFYNLLIKFSYALTFYSLLSSLFFWWLFYFKAIKVDLVEYAIDFLLMSFLTLFTFVILSTIFFIDTSLASLKTMMYGLGFHEANLWQSFLRVLAVDLQTQASLTKECISCKEQSLKLNSLAFKSETTFSVNNSQKVYSQLLLNAPSSAAVSLVVDDSPASQPTTSNSKAKSYPEMQSTEDRTQVISFTIDKEGGNVAGCIDATVVLDEAARSIQQRPNVAPFTDSEKSFGSMVSDKVCQAVSEFKSVVIAKGVEAAKDALVKTGQDVLCTSNVDTDQKSASRHAKNRGSG